MRDVSHAVVPLITVGLIGTIVTAILGFFWAPAVDSNSWNAPEAYRIIYWHVPFAWVSFLAFAILFLGSIFWYAKRSDFGWVMVTIGSEMGLLFGLGVVISGPIWGAAEWGVPWDWGDVSKHPAGLFFKYSHHGTFAQYSNNSCTPLLPKIIW